MDSWMRVFGIGRLASIFSMFVANDKLSDCCQGSWWITFIWMENSYLNEWKKVIWMNGFNGWKAFDKKEGSDEWSKNHQPSDEKRWVNQDLPFKVRIIEARITIINNTNLLFTYHLTL